MGSIGNCEDNAKMESFWARVQVELLNRRRRHSALGMLSPVEYELRTPPVA
ncbi:hypothetical protein AB0H86_07105 [Streptomyces sp. NPDC050997]|uniref:hypothetical protein n=1 Tax=Streptomyces sp. NPDC050997 TaxID=3155519 RepID=UPI003430FF9F